MAGEWDEVSIGEVCELGDGAHAKVKRTDFGVPYLTSKNIGNGSLKLESFDHISEADYDRLFPVDSRAVTRLKPGDILTGIIGTFGNLYLYKKSDRFAISSAVAIVRPDRTRLWPPYLYYYLTSPYFRQKHSSYAAGSVQGYTNLPTIRQLPALVPPLAEQKAIASVLGALDDKIELNRRMNATLESMARALFQSWFVDFDPARAKLDGRQPFGLDPATTALFPANFEHGENGLLPKGWRRSALEEVCEINTWTLGKKDVMESLEYIEISQVNQGDIANIVTYTRGDEPSRARRRLRHGDTVLSTVRPDRGSYFLALNPPENRVASTGFAVLTPTEVPWSFLHAALTQTDVSDHLGQMADGGAYPAVRPEVIGAMQVALPNESKILEAFHHYCAPLFEQAEANRTQSRTLATLRDTILPKLLSGELRIN